jgi:AcrR family transcriptional regulator
LNHHATDDQRERHPGGRPLDQTRDDAIRMAALEVLAEDGYDRLTIDAVAARARAGKATVYRRWRSKAELVVDAVACRAPAIGPPPDTGSLRGDLHAMVTRKLGALEPGEADQMLGLVSALPRHPELQRAFRECFITPRHGMLGQILERAVARGEIPSARDLAVVADVLPALVLHRLFLTGRPPDEEFLRSVVDQVLVPLATAPAPTAEVG